MEDEMDLKSKIRVIEDFPKEGISFKDITTVLKDSDDFHDMIDQVIDRLEGYEFDYIVGVEARGFILGAPVAYAMDKGFVPVRKPGKLPSKTLSEKYALEYGEAEVEMHEDAFEKGARVVILDDLLATGGTVEATVKLIEKTGAEVVAIGFLAELTGLNGREKLNGKDVFSLVTWEY